MIQFSDYKREQDGKLVEYEDLVADIANIPVIKDINFLLFKNNINYTWAKFMQASKITKRLLTMVFTNSNLASIREYLNYKILDKMRALLTKLP